MSRLRENPKRLFEAFFEVARPTSAGGDAIVLQVYPPDYDNKDLMSNVPKFAYPCKIDIDLPWFDVFHKLLNFLADLIHQSENSDLMAFLRSAYTLHVPRPGEPVTIVADQKMFNFIAPSPNDLPTLDDCQIFLSVLGSYPQRNLTEYYNAVDANNMMRIFASMLQERRIIFTSKKLSRLTACIHASAMLLYPMHWQHIYIPVLPRHLLDYVAAPMPYLIGVHTSLMEVVVRKRMEIGDAVIVNTDSNEVKTEHQDLETLPDVISSFLREQLKEKRVQAALAGGGDVVSRAFLMALVRLIGGYRDVLRFHPDADITFDEDAFVRTRSSQSMQLFLENMLQLQIFQQFINSRLEILNDGGGFQDVFEQESLRYADTLGSQSKYREWMSKQKRKLKAGGRDIKYIRMKVKEAGKRMQTKIKEINDNKISPPRLSRRITHSRKPTRPPPPRTSKPFPTEARCHDRRTLPAVHYAAGCRDDSDLRLSYHSIDVSLMSDLDMQEVMVKSASAEDILESQCQSSSDGDVSSIPSSEALSQSDENLTDIPVVDMQSTHQMSCQQSVTSSPVCPVSSPNNKASTHSYIVRRNPLISSSQQIPSCVASSGRVDITSHQLSSTLQPPQRRHRVTLTGQLPDWPASDAVRCCNTIVTINRSCMPLYQTTCGGVAVICPSPIVHSATRLPGDITQTNPPALATTPESHLISLESSESDGGCDQFDPLSRPAPERGRYKGSRTSLTRSKAFRHQAVTTPLQSHGSVDFMPRTSGVNGQGTTKPGTSLVDSLRALFDPLVLKSTCCSHRYVSANGSIPTLTSVFSALQTHSTKHHSMHCGSPSIFSSNSPSVFSSNSPSVFSSNSPSIFSTSGPSIFSSNSPSIFSSNSPSVFSSSGPSIFSSNSPSIFSSSGPSIFCSNSPSIFSSNSPSVFNSSGPSIFSTSGPSIFSSNSPSIFSTSGPSIFSTSGPSVFSSNSPSIFNSSDPSVFNSSGPSIFSTSGPSIFSSNSPSIFSSNSPSVFSSSGPSVFSSNSPSVFSSNSPSIFSSSGPSVFSSNSPSVFSSNSPSIFSSSGPSVFSSSGPSIFSSNSPSVFSSNSHSIFSSSGPSIFCSNSPSIFCSNSPSIFSSNSPSVFCSNSPSIFSSNSPSVFCSNSPSIFSSNSPSVFCSNSPSIFSSNSPSVFSSSGPSIFCSNSHSIFSSSGPSIFCSNSPSIFCSNSPSIFSSNSPSVFCSNSPSIFSSNSPSVFCSNSPSIFSSNSPSVFSSSGPSVFNSNSPSIFSSNGPSIYSSSGPSVFSSNSPSVFSSSGPSVFSSSGPSIFCSSGPSIFSSNSPSIFCPLPTTSYSSLPHCQPVSASHLSSVSHLTGSGQTSFASSSRSDIIGQATPGCFNCTGKVHTFGTGHETAPPVFRDVAHNVSSCVSLDFPSQALNRRSPQCSSVPLKVSWEQFD